MSPSDRECVQLCLDGETEMFRHLIARYEFPLSKYLLGRLRNQGEAAEAAQETMVRAFSNLATLQKAESFYPWLLGIANRVAMEQVRRGRMAKPVELDAATEPSEEIDLTESGQDYELTQAIGALPEKYQQVILLRFYGEQSCEQISASLDVSLGTVTSRLSRAYALLRKALRPSDESKLKLEIER